MDAASAAAQTRYNTRRGEHKFIKRYASPPPRSLSSVSAVPAVSVRPAGGDAENGGVDLGEVEAALLLPEATDMEDIGQMVVRPPGFPRVFLGDRM